MPDDSQLGYNADPNNVNSSGTAGEILLYNAPFGTQYIQTDGTHWRKTAIPNTWTETGGGSNYYVPLTTSGDYIVPTGNAFVSGNKFTIAGADILTIEGTSQLVLVG